MLAFQCGPSDTLERYTTEITVVCAAAVHAAESNNNSHDSDMHAQLKVKTQRLFFGILLVSLCGAAAPQDISSSAKTEEITPVKKIGVFVLPYYQAAKSPEGHPVVAVSKYFDTQLASNQQQDILAVRDAIQANPQYISPMSLMVLAIRLYDVGLRDDAVFWFYAAKNRYVVMSHVLDVKSTALAQVEDSVRNFAILAGPFFNSYAFCDFSKQRALSLKAINWTEQNPYEAMFSSQLPALPGDRAENAKQGIADIRLRAQKEQQSLESPETQAQFNRTRKERHVPEQFCWAS